MWHISTAWGKHANNTRNYLGKNNNTKLLGKISGRHVRKQKNKTNKQHTSLVKTWPKKDCSLAFNTHYSAFGTPAAASSLKVKKTNNKKTRKEGNNDTKVNYNTCYHRYFKKVKKEHTSPETMDAKKDSSLNLQPRILDKPTLPSYKNRDTKKVIQRHNIKETQNNTSPSNIPRPSTDLDPFYFSNASKANMKTNKKDKICINYTTIKPNENKHLPPSYTFQTANHQNHYHHHREESPFATPNNYSKPQKK